MAITLGAANLRLHRPMPWAMAQEPATDRAPNPARRKTQIRRAPTRKLRVAKQAMARDESISRDACGFLLGEIELRWRGRAELPIVARERKKSWGPIRNIYQNMKGR